MTGLWAIGVLLAGQPVGAKQDVVKDPDGKPIAVIVDCNSCNDAQPGAACADGVEAGFHAGQRCGACLIDANYGKRILYPYDLTLSGTLKDENGAPLKQKFVKLFTSANFGVRTRTLDDGRFFMRLGATAERKGSKPLLIDLGTRVMPKDSKAPQYALYMLPEGFAACGDKKAAEQPARKPEGEADKKPAAKAEKP
jgi:hypothetical protein